MEKEHIVIFFPKERAAARGAVNAAVINKAKKAIFTYAAPRGRPGTQRRTKNYKKSVRKGVNKDNKNTFSQSLWFLRSSR